jgi:hypothetical protein
MIVIMGFMVSTSLCFAQSQITIDCAPIYSALNSYFDAMNSDHAESLLALLQGDDRFWCQDSEHIRSEYFTTHSYLLELFTNNLETVYEQLLARDKAAIDVLFRWYYYMADGVYTEEIEMVLGRIIPDAPEFFLLALSRNMAYVQRLDGILFHIEPDAIESECQELQKRYTAVSQTSNSEIEDVKYRVLALFKEEIDARCHGIH